MKRTLGLIAAAVISTVTVDAAMADKRQLLGSYRAWDAFVLKKDDGEKICYMISQPKAKWPKSLRHGNPFITVSHKPSRDIKNELNFVAAYNFKKDSKVSLIIDKRKNFSLFTQNDGAWGYDSAQDNAMAKALKRGNNVSVKSTSSRGNKTSYRFSLSGFTAAHNAITKACR